MPPKVQKSKAAKALAAMSSAKSKGKKKKWSKGKLREKKNHRVMFNKAILDKVMTDVPKKMKVITVYSMIENYKINGPSHSSEFLFRNMLSRACDRVFVIGLLISFLSCCCSVP